MDAKYILQADWLDILFDGRNKMYGAYSLRKHYPTKLFTALLVTFSFAVLFLVLIKIPGSELPERIDLKAIPEPVWVSIAPQKVLPLPAKKHKTQTLRSSADRFTTPVVVNNSTVPAEKIMSLSDAFGIASSTHRGPVQPQVAQPVNLPSLSPVASTPTVALNETVLDDVDESAIFPGGLRAWKRYLEQNLDVEKPISAGAPVGTYVVVVRFIVGKDGKIRDVQAETSNGYGMEEEAINIIRKGPRWNPALQNSEKVDAWHRQAITFLVAEE